MTEFRTSFTIADRQIGGDADCYVIAEGGVSHFGEMGKARQLIDLAAAAGADVYKTQHYDTDTLIGPSSPEWRERLRPKQMPDYAIREMRDYCHQVGVPFLCTPHDETALEFLQTELDVPAFKIGSGELENWSFIAKIAAIGKPIILSTGMYSLEQIAEAAKVVQQAGGTELAILHCVTAYPTNASEVNLSVMAQIREFFSGPVGYSDHTEGTGVALAAVALGAQLVEKHLTLDRDIPNAQDWKVACDESSFPRFVRDLRDIEVALGGGPKELASEELKSIKWARKSLTTVRDIPAGTQLEQADIVIQRPGSGMPGAKLSSIVGRRTNQEIGAGTVLVEDHLD